MARSALRILVLLVGLMGVLLIFERHLIYFPARELDVTPRDLGLAFEDLRLRTSDGVGIHGWLLPVEQARHTILVCHGNGGNIAHRLDRALLMQAHLKTSVVLFDYRGYGQSEGRTDEDGTYRDVRAVHEELVQARGLSPHELILFGESLGGAVALQLAVEQPAAALVLESSFTSIPDMARAVYPFLPLWPFVRTRYDSLAKIPELKMPLLVMHGERDDIVPFEQGRRLFAAAPEPKRFFAIPGAHHNDTYAVGGDAYWRVLGDFLGSLSPDG